jgi:hypothetical protein
MKYTQVQQMRKRASDAGYLETLENSDNPAWRMAAELERKKMQPYVDKAYNKGRQAGYHEGLNIGTGNGYYHGKKEGESSGYLRGHESGFQASRDKTVELIQQGMLIGAPVGAVAGTGISALLLRKDMSNAKKLAILLAGAGIGGVTGAGVGGAVSGLLG